MAKRIRQEQRPQQAEKTGYIAYYRVSTDKQGESGLGLEAQQELVKRVAKNGPVLAEFTEVETAKKSTANNRPQLEAAIEEAKTRGAVLLIAKIDRLARNVYFISGLMESGVEFIAADMPQANRLTVHIMAAFAEHEARAISDRTKAALAALKARGVKLGNPRWAECLEKARQARVFKIAKPSKAVLETIERLRLEGQTLRGIAERLNGLGVRTPRGGRWHTTSVRTALRVSEVPLPARPKPTNQEAVMMMKTLKGSGLTLRAIADKLNEEGQRTPSGARWYASTVNKALKLAA
jgi:DNA invertase Pin-like site-specific DNA recombinase